jgi:hypothetical protein
MKKAIEATQAEFESASHRTPEYLAWHRLFKREFTKFLNSRGMTGIEFSKPNHFDLSGFFKDGAKDQIWYFSISDLRGFKDNMLIRTAAHYKDFTGGANQYLPLNRGSANFTEAFDKLMLQDFRRRDVGTTHPFVANTIKTMGGWR